MIAQRTRGLRYVTLLLSLPLGTPFLPARGESPERVIKMTASRFEYQPSTITLKKGEAVVLELISLDRIHGFNLFGFNVRRDLLPGEAVRLRIIPDRTGSFPFSCDVFCGEGHEEMNGQIIVTE